MNASSFQEMSRKKLGVDRRESGAKHHQGPTTGCRRGGPYCRIILFDPATIPVSTYRFHKEPAPPGTRTALDRGVVGNLPCDLFLNQYLPKSHVDPNPW